MPNEIAAKIAKKAARKAFRAQNRAYIEAVADAAGTPLNRPETGPGASNACTKARKPRKAKKRRKVPARKRAFKRLADACRDHVKGRGMARNGGICEIGLSCQGFGLGEVWYHGWPQKGGNGLKYDVRSHFYACSACNMGEYGARMRGDDRYINRHKELLGVELWRELDGLKGRKQISTVEANEMAERIEHMTENKEWGPPLVPTVYGGTMEEKESDGN